MSLSVGPARRPMAEINVTPFVDVVLVLLIIFMVTAPFLQGGLEIDLPKVASRGLDVREGLVISVRADRTIAVGNRIVPLGRDYIELLAVVDEDQASGSPVGRAVRERVDLGLVHRAPPVLSGLRHGGSLR